LSAPSGDSLYTTKIIKAGALLADTRILLVNWDDHLPVRENLQRLQRANLFGKASRSRVEDILAIFHQRYLVDEAVTKALVTFAQAGMPTEQLDPILYYYATQADLLLCDIVTEVLWPRLEQGKMDVGVFEIATAINRWVAEGKTVRRWSDDTIVRVAQGLLASLRDWRILRGAVNKQLAPPYLPVTTFAYLALALQHQQASGERLVAAPEWRLFFLSRPAVERLFLEAHQAHWLEYYAAGSIIRITFPTESLAEYAHVIVHRAP
jgi:hypothetical protein